MKPSYRLLAQARVIFICMFLWVLSESCLANLVANGSFENPAIANGGVSVGTLPADWLPIGGGTDIIANSYRGGVASNGSQFVDLIGVNVGTFPSGLSQVVHLTAGTTYRLSFDYNGGRYQDGTPTTGSVLNFSLDNFISGSANVDALNVFAENWPVTTPWQSVSSEFLVVTTGEYQLKFQTNTGAFGSPYLDNVAIEAVIPEPATLLLGMVAGVVCLLPRGRRA